MDEAKTRINIAGRNINSLRYTDDVNCNGRKLGGTKKLLKGERGE